MHKESLIEDDTENSIQNNRQLLYCYGRLTDSLKNPIKLSTYALYPIKKIACGSNHCIILFEDNRLGVFGSNKNGQLAFSTDMEMPFVHDLCFPKFKINELSNYHIWDIAAGNDYSLLLIGVGHITSLIKFGSKKEEVSMFDDSISLSTIGFNSFIAKDFKKLNKKITNIASIYAFNDRIVLVTGGNQVYIGGCNFDNNDYNQFHDFKLIGSFDNPIKSVAVGTSHCLILDGMSNNKLIERQSFHYH